MFIVVLIYKENSNDRDFWENPMIYFGLIFSPLVLPIIAVFYLAYKTYIKFIKGRKW